MDGQPPAVPQNQREGAAESQVKKEDTEKVGGDMLGAESFSF